MNRAAILAVLFAILAAAGVCYVILGPEIVARIDGSSDESFKSSLDAVKESLPADKHERFEAAMAAHARAALLPQGDTGNPLAGLMALSADKDGPSRRLRGRLDGLTAQQIIRTAPSIPDAAAGLPFTGDLLQARRNANEAAAIATLKNISSAQAQCQASGVIDVNGNGAGEYGSFAELAGAVAVRSGSSKIAPPVLSSAFAKVDGDGIVTRSGYHFRIYLPDVKSRGVHENGLSVTGVDPNLAEVLWCCYAWPTAAGDSGNRAFFINQAGDVLACKNADGRYSGAAQGPSVLAAFDAGSTDIGAVVAANTTGTDCQTWVVVD